MSILEHFQISYQLSSPNSGKIMIKGLKLPEKPDGFSVLTKIWKSTRRGLKLSEVFRVKTIEDGYECTFALRGLFVTEGSIMDRVNRFWKTLGAFLSSSNYARYCDYVNSNQKPDVVTFNKMLDEFLAGISIPA